MQEVRASTSSGSTAGNMPIRSWLRPSLRYGSVSRIPFARSTDATAAASTDSAKSIVPTTSERSCGSVTNGVAYGDLSAQVYSRFEESVVRATAQSSPPRWLTQSIWSAISHSVATAGVLYVWSLPELSTAVARSSDAGIHRPEATTDA